MSFRVRARYKTVDAHAVMITRLMARQLPVYVEPGSCDHYAVIPVPALASFYVRSRFLKWGWAGDMDKKEIYEQGEKVEITFKRADLRRIKRRA